SAVAVSAGPAGAGLYCRRIRVRLYQPGRGTGPHHTGTYAGRRIPDGRAGRGRTRRAVHVPPPVLQRLLPQGAVDAPRDRRCRRAVPAVPAVAIAPAAYRTGLGPCPAVGPPVRVGHAGIFRIARRQELFLLL